MINGLWQIHTLDTNSRNGIKSMLIAINLIRAQFALSRNPVSSKAGF